MSKAHIICIGNPGCGKSTLLNSMIGRAVFKSGFSAGSGLTTECETHRQGAVTYVDTPGLADAKRRGHAARAICKALNSNANCKILFVTTLEAGQVRPEDRATIELVIEALLEAGVSDRGLAVIVNKVPVHEVKSVLKHGFEVEVRACDAPRPRGCCHSLKGMLVRRSQKVQDEKKRLVLDRVICVEEDAAIEDQDQQVLKLTQRFTDFIAEMPSVFIRSNAVTEIQHDRFECLVKELQEQICELSKDNRKLRDEIQILQRVDVNQRVDANPSRQEKASGKVPPEEEDVPLKQGDTVILIDVVFEGGKTAVDAGECGQVGPVSNESSLSVQFDSHPEAVQVPREKLCLPSEVPSFKQATVRELAYRGIELGAILKFYRSLGRKFMMDFNPEKSTTFQVVRDAIIPETETTGLAYASQVHRGRRLATRMVSHSWGNRFAHTVAAVVADALDEPVYKRLLELLAPQAIDDLVDDLKKQGKLNLTYWICPFSVNQHRSICKGDAFRCQCTTAMHGNKSPFCEMDQFDKMMAFMFQERSPQHRQIIAIDNNGVIFQRAWVVAELVEVLISIEGLQQAFKAFDEDTLKDLRARGDVNIHDCCATRPEDKIMILDKARELMAGRGFTDELFHQNLNKRIFGLLEVTCKEAEKMSKQHVFFIGNKGVGKTTIISSLIGGAAAFADADSSSDIFQELEYEGKVFLEATGLANAQTRESAAKAITSALMRDGKYMLFFIVTLEAGRVRPQDKETMQLVLQSTNKASIKHNYTVVINKITRCAINKFQESAELEGIRQEFAFGCEPGFSPNIRWVEKVPDASVLHLPANILVDAPCLHIKCSKVEHVQSETLEDMMQKKRDEKNALAHENQTLQFKLRDWNKTIEAAKKVLDVSSDTLHLPFQGINDQRAKAIAEALPSCTSLKTLRLSANQIGNEGAKAIAAVLPSCRSLRVVQLDRNQIGDDGAQAIAAALPNCTTLTSLHLDTNLIGNDGAKALAPALRNCRSLYDLRLSGNSFGDEGVAAFFDVLPLDLSLKVLADSTHKVGCETAKAIARRLPHTSALQELDLNGYSIGDTETKAIAVALPNCTSLQELDLCTNKIGDAGAQAIAAALPNCRSLNYLRLRDNKIGDEGAKAIASALQNCTSLQRLDLQRNQIGDDGAKAIASAFQNCTSLQRLDLHRNQIGDDGAKAIASALQNCTSLQTLRLDDNQIGDGGAKAIAAALPNCRSLNYLQLRDNQIGDEGAKALREAWKRAGKDDGLYLGYQRLLQD